MSSNCEKIDLIECENCGLKNRPRKFCISCGHPLDKTSLNQKSHGCINQIDIEQVSPEIEPYYKEFLSVTDVVFQESYSPAIEYQIGRELKIVQEIFKEGNLDNIKNFFQKEFKNLLIHNIYNFKRIKESFLSLAPKIKYFGNSGFDNITRLESEYRRLISHMDWALKSKEENSIIVANDESNNDMDKNVENYIRIAKKINEDIASNNEKALYLLNLISQEIRKEEYKTMGGLLPCV